MTAPDSHLPASAASHTVVAAFEPSSWLQRHLESAVAWQPWGEAALALARELDRPLLLVVAGEGCLPFEQMAVESFADAATAAVMNDGYVCCLADARWHRELDCQLQLVHQLLTGRAGGWPLLAMVDPLDGRPCFAGTYLPATATGPLPGFADFLRQALAHFRRQRPALQEQGARLARAFDQMMPPALPADTPLDAAPLTVARRQLEGMFDREAGTFTRGQPISSATAATRLLRHWSAGAAAPEPDLQALFMATLALTCVAAAPVNTVPTSLGGELQAFAAAAAGTGDPAFREAAEARFAALSGLGTLGAPDETPGSPSNSAAPALPATEDWHRLRAMAHAARSLDRPDWAETTLAQYATACARHASGAASGRSHGDSAAALATATAILELRWSPATFNLACTLADACCEAPPDSTATLPGLPRLPQQTDNTLPAAEGLAALALYRLGCLCGNARWRTAAGGLLRRAWRPMNDSPATHLALLDALEEQVTGLETLVIRGDAAEGERWASALGRWYAPARQTFVIPAATPDLPPQLARLVPTDNTTQAWLFTGDGLPVASDSLEQLVRQLRDRLQRR